MENTVTSQNIQQYVRIGLYYIFGALATHGMTVPDGTKSLIASVVGLLATLAWTAYGTRLNGLLEQIKEKAGVEAVEVKVDPTILTPLDITQNTSPGIVAKPAQVG
jgi:hypothetical protein